MPLIQRIPYGSILRKCLFLRNGSYKQGQIYRGGAAAPYSSCHLWSDRYEKNVFNLNYFYQVKKNNTVILQQTWTVAFPNWKSIKPLCPRTPCQNLMLMLIPLNPIQQSLYYWPTTKQQAPHSRKKKWLFFKVFIFLFSYNVFLSPLVNVLVLVCKQSA